MRDRQCLFERETQGTEPGAHAIGVEVKIELCKLHGLQGKGTPALPPKPVAQDGLDVQLVGELQNENGIRRERIAHLSQSPGSIGHVVQRPDHCGRIEYPGDEWKAIDIRRHINVPVRIAEARLGLLQLRARIIHENDALKAGSSEGVLRPAPAPSSSSRRPLLGSKRFNAMASTRSSYSRPPRSQKEDW